jgi:hypothetical protein
MTTEDDDWEYFLSIYGRHSKRYWTTMLVVWWIGVLLILVAVIWIIYLWVS